MTDESTFGLSFLAGALIVALVFTRYRRRNPLLDAIPTVGFSDPLLSYLSAIRYYSGGGLSMLKEGYEKAKPGIFKIATPRRWMVLPTSAQLIEDIRNAPDGVLSMSESVKELIQAEYTLGLLDQDDSYHTTVIRSKLTRNTTEVFNQVCDEFSTTLEDCIPMASEEWVKVSVLPTLQQIVCRTSSRIFVGSPLCRNRDYQTLVLNFTVNVLKSAAIITMFPKPLKPIAARILCNIPSQVRQAKEFLRPLVEERLAKMEEVGASWNNAPDDMLMWLMSKAKGSERSLEGLARRMLVVNFAAINNTSRAFTRVFYRLLGNPEYLVPLRQEVEAAIAEEGWTKAAMDKLPKMDSFLHETQRLDNPSVVTMLRLVLRPFTLSNGQTIPVGTLVGIPLDAVHRDGEIYPNPEEFDGFRFSKLHEEEGDVSVSGYQAVSTSPEQLSFGLGRHACPGRFFAVNEIKAMLAHIIVTYDFKFEEGKGVPPDVCFGPFRNPGDANVLFKKRQKY
ncbi:cytochrome P450 [Lactifluus volemus]|nr:cytochrome P450 [Lactifluus volemus]